MFLLLQGSGPICCVNFVLRTSVPHVRLFLVLFGHALSFLQQLMANARKCSCTLWRVLGVSSVSVLLQFSAENNPPPFFCTFFHTTSIVWLCLLSCGKEGLEGWLEVVNWQLCGYVFSFDFATRRTRAQICPAYCLGFRFSNHPLITLFELVSSIAHLVCVHFLTLLWYALSLL